MTDTAIETAIRDIEEMIRTSARRRGLQLRDSSDGSYGLVDQNGAPIAGDPNGLSLAEVAAQVGLTVGYTSNGVPGIHHSTEWRGQ